MKECDCEDWKLNINECLTIDILAWNHNMEYKGKQYKFCGWCGKELKEKKEKTNDLP